MTQDMTGFLLDQFEILADASGGVQRLRELILQLAVTGRLGTGDEKDEPVIIPEFCSVTPLKSKSEKPSKFDTVVHNLVNTVSLPDNWRITVLNSLGDWSTGGTPSRSQFEYFNGDIPWIKSGDLNDGIILNTDENITLSGLNNSNAKLLPKGTVSIALYGATIGRIGILGIEASTNQACANCIPNTSKVNTRYFYYFIIQQRIYLIEAGQGGAQPNITNGILRNWPIFLPPLTEQHRIVEKVDNLIALCDDLEAKQTQKHTHLVKLGTGSLNALQQSTTEEELIRWWGHLQTNFGLIFDCPENVEALRQTILQLAVTGRLGTGDERDEPMLDDKVVTSNEEKKLDWIPNNWQLSILENVSEIVMGNSPPGSSYNNHGEGVPLINGPVEFTPGPFGTTIVTQYTTEPTKMCKRGDLLICVRGSTTGRTNIAGNDACIGRGVALMRAKHNQQFINLFVYSNQQRFYEKGTGSTFPSISQKEITKFPIYLPPLAEQQRIVEKVDCLMALCDQLEEQIEHRSKGAISLSNAIIQQVIGIT